MSKINVRRLIQQSTGKPKHKKGSCLVQHSKAKRALGTATQNVLRHGAPRVSSPLGQRLADSSPAMFRFPASDSVSILTGHIEQARPISFEASTPRGRSPTCLLYSVRRVGAPGVGLVVRARGSAQSRSWTPQPSAQPQLTKHVSNPPRSIKQTSNANPS